MVILHVVVAVVPVSVLVASFCLDCPRWLVREDCCWCCLVRLGGLGWDRE